MFFQCDLFCVQKGLHRGLPVTIFASVGPLRIVLLHPHVQIPLKLFDRGIEPPSECYPVEFVLYGPVEALTYAVGLWAPRLGPGMVYVLQTQIELVSLCEVTDLKKVLGKLSE